MIKRILLIAIVPGIMLCFLFTSTATAARIQATLGWHNLIVDDFYLIVEDPQNWDATTIRSGQLHSSTLEDRDGIDARGLGLDADYENMWRLETRNKFDKWINKKGLHKLRKAAKRQQRDFNADGTKKGWKTVYNGWKADWKNDRYAIWDLYIDESKNNEDEYTDDKYNQFIFDALNELGDRKIKGKIDGVKFTAHLEIFENPFTDSSPVPEPATMVLFGIGLLGLAGVNRRKN